MSDCNYKKNSLKIYFPRNHKYIAKSSIEDALDAFIEANNGVLLVGLRESTGFLKEKKIDCQTFAYKCL